MATPGEPDRTTRSQQIEVAFDADGTMTSLVQQGAFEYHEAREGGQRAAYAEKGTYNPQNETLRLTGNPRVVDGGMVTTADTVVLNRATGAETARITGEAPRSTGTSSFCPRTLARPQSIRSTSP